MSDPVAVINSLPADLLANFADFSRPDPNLLVLHLLNNVPCVKENRFLSWWLSGSLCAGFDPIPCNPNNLEWAIRLGLRQLETDKEWPDEPEADEEDHQEDQEELIWPVAVDPASLVSPVPVLPDGVQE